MRDLDDEGGVTGFVREIELTDASATEALGSALADVLPSGGVVFLHGQLGAGKTTLVRGLLRAFGYTGFVRSPTYALVESYEVEGRSIHHFDLYRLSDPEELEFIGLRDYLDAEAVSLIEWPERGKGLLPEPDLSIGLAMAGKGRCARLWASREEVRDTLTRINIK